MTWERSMLALFDDLEQQAEGLALAERDAEVAELSLAEYAQVSLAARLHASTGHQVALRLLAGRVLSGRLERVGEDFLLLSGTGGEWVVRTAAVVAVGGLSPRAQSEETWSVVDRLGLRSVLRRLAGEALTCTFHHVDDQRLEGRISRVGRDFVELQVGEGPQRSVQVVPFTGLAAVQGRG